MPTTAELAEITQQASRSLEQQRVNLFPEAKPQLRPYTVEGSLLAASDLPTRYDLPIVSRVTPLPLPVFEEPEPAALVPPFTLPARTPTPMATEEQPSPLVAVAAPVSYMTYNHADMRSSPQAQIEAGIQQYHFVPEIISLSPYCKLILELMSWGEIYHFEGYQIQLAADNWLTDDQVKLQGRQGPLPQPKTAQLPAWIADLASASEEDACGGVGGDGGDDAALHKAS